MFYMNDEPKEKTIIFIDLPGVLYPATLNTARSTLEWDKHAVFKFTYLLQKINSHYKRECRIIVTGKYDAEDLKTQLDKYDICGYVADDMYDFIAAEGENSKPELIRHYLKQHPDIKKYVVLDSMKDTELEVSFPLRCVIISGLFSSTDAMRISRKMFWGTGWESDYMFYEGREIEDGFKKVIFLDIDGVLNRDHTSGQEDEPKVEPEFIENLAEIVRQTGAEIIMSSSWRYGFRDLNGEKMGDVERTLFRELAVRGMFIAGATPTIRNGPDGRPFEVKQWLGKRQEVKSFVILDDEDFWSWNWLAPFVVTTSYVTEDGRYTKRYSGLDKQYIEPAIRILNQFDREERWR